MADAESGNVASDGQVAGTDTAVAAVPDTDTASTVMSSTSSSNNTSTDVAVAPITSLNNVTITIVEDATWVEG